VVKGRNKKRPRRDPCSDCSHRVLDALKIQKIWPQVVATARPSRSRQQELHFMIGDLFSWIQEAKNNGVTGIVEGSKQNMTEERRTQRTKRAPPPTYSSDRYGLGSMKE